jgi:CMP-N-acetylneuraminic acid synthetase
MYQNLNVALIPLRGGSKGIAKKNIKTMVGKPLCAWVLEAAANARHIDQVYVSTDCLEIADTVMGLDLGIEVIHRPPNLANDTASTETVMLHFAQIVKFSNLVTIQATSPLLKSYQLDSALIKFALEDCDSMLSASRFKRFFWSDDHEPINYKPANRPRRQDHKGVLMENGAFYITKRHVLLHEKCRLGGDIKVYETPENMSLEIDSPEDWNQIKQLLIEDQEARQLCSLKEIMPSSSYSSTTLSAQL